MESPERIVEGSQAEYFKEYCDKSLEKKSEGIPGEIPNGISSNIPLAILGENPNGILEKITEIITGRTCKDDILRRILEEISEGSVAEIPAVFHRCILQEFLEES